MRTLHSLKKGKFGIRWSGDITFNRPITVPTDGVYQLTGTLREFNLTFESTLTNARFYQEMLTGNGLSMPIRITGVTDGL